MATEPGWLRAWADASAVLLLLEVCFALLIVTALVFLLAFGARWLRVHVAPVLNAATPRARQALRMADAGTERVVRGVAEIYGIRQAVEAGVRALWRGLAVDALSQSAPAAPASAETPVSPDGAEAPLAPQAGSPTGGAGSPTGGEAGGVRTPGVPTDSRREPEWQRPPEPPRQPAGGRDTGGMSAHAG